MYIVTTDSYPGYWGNGDTVDAALANCKKAGGRVGPWVVIEINAFYKDGHIDGFGRIWADAVNPDIDRSEWPPVVAQAWTRGARGKMTPVSWPDLQPV